MAPRWACCSGGCWVRAGRETKAVVERKRAGWTGSGPRLNATRQPATRAGLQQKGRDAPEAGGVPFVQSRIATKNIETGGQVKPWRAQVAALDAGYYDDLNHILTPEQRAQATTVNSLHAATTDPSQARLDKLNIVVTAVIIGVGVCLLRLSVAWFLSRRLVHSATLPVPPAVAILFEWVQEQLKLRRVVRLGHVIGKNGLHSILHDARRHLVP